jgi:hypothetical protein
MRCNVNALRRFLLRDAAAKTLLTMNGKPLFIWLVYNFSHNVMPYRPVICGKG